MARTSMPLARQSPGDGEGVIDGDRGSLGSLAATTLSVMVAVSVCARRKPSRLDRPWKWIQPLVSSLTSTVNSSGPV